MDLRREIKDIIGNPLPAVAGAVIGLYIIKYIPIPSFTKKAIAIVGGAVGGQMLWKKLIEKKRSTEAFRDAPTLEGVKQTI